MRSRRDYIGFLDHLWIHVPFMLRQAQHEREWYHNFSALPVRPELVEGRCVLLLSPFQIGALY